MNEITGTGDWDCEQCYRPVIGPMLYQEADDFSGDVLVLHPQCADGYFKGESAR